MKIPYSPLPINDEDHEKKKQFTVFHKYQFSFKIIFGIISIFVVLGGFGQQASLPLYLTTFGSFVGAFFVLWYCAFVFTVFFGIGSIIFRGAITSEMRQLKWIPYMALIGFFDALNSILVVYSSFLARVPGALQTILLQFFCPCIHYSK